jgi:hypothetical protein
MVVKFSYLDGAILTSHNAKYIPDISILLESAR